MPGKASDPEILLVEVGPFETPVVTQTKMNILLTLSIAFKHESGAL